MNLSIFELMEALRGILAKAPKGSSMELTVERFRIADKINYVLDLLGGKKASPSRRCSRPGR